jgi:hypothetical protein
MIITDLPFARAAAAGDRRASNLPEKNAIMKLKINGGQLNQWIDIATEDGDPVCKVSAVTTINTMGGYTKNWNTTEARAAEIVKAVNEHAALVAVAEAAETHQASKPGEELKNWAVIQTALKALAAVRAGSEVAK